MIKILHIGDIHLDSPFYSKNKDLRSLLSKGMLDSFNSAIEFCINKGVHILLIAGDMFDNDYLGFNTQVHLERAFERLKNKGIDVYYVTGNHDPGDELIKNGRISLDTNVKVMWDDEIKTYDGDINGLKYRIVGVGHHRRGESRNLIKDFPVKEKGIVHIGLAHTMVSGVSKDATLHKEYLPTTLNDLLSKGYDYWALGHIHKREMLDEKKSIAYCGNIQGRSFKELGNKGGIYIEIDEGIANTSIVDFSSLAWHEIYVDVNVDNYQQLLRNILMHFEQYVGKNNIEKNKSLFRISIKGQTPLYKQLSKEDNIDTLEDEIKGHTGALYVEIKDKGIRPIKIMDKDLLDNPYIEYMVSQLSSKDEDILKALMDIELLDMSVSDKEVYIKETLIKNREEILDLFKGDE